MLLRRLLLPIICLLLVVPATAGASPSQIYDDCQDNGRLDESYSQSDYRKALKEMPEDLDEYTDCSEQVRAAQAGLTKGGDSGGGTSDNGAGGGGGTAGGGGGPADIPQGNGVGSVPLGPDNKPLDPEIDARPDERADLNAARAGDTVRPTSAGVRPGEPDSELPSALVVLLILAGLAGVTAAALGVRQVLTGRAASA